MELKAKLQERIDNQNTLITKVEKSMDAMAEPQKTVQAFSLKLLKDELTQLTADQLALPTTQI